MKTIIRLAVRYKIKLTAFESWIKGAKPINVNMLHPFIQAELSKYTNSKYIMYKEPALGLATFMIYSSQPIVLEFDLESDPTLQQET
jgi:hypothetical protein